MNRLLGHLQYSTSVLTGRLAPGRRATVFPDDVFLVSYPKSGNTWMRFLVGNLANPDDPVTFANVETRVPSIYGMPDRELRRVPRPRYIKTHESFHPSYQTIIYAVRDPRDVAVSYYHYHLKIRQLPPGFPIDSFIPDFIAENLYARFGPWAEHVMGWLAMAPSRKKFLFLKYEDLLKDAENELTKIAAFLGIELSPKRRASIIELSSANRMRGLERKEADKWSTTKRTRSDVPFVRAAKSGQWSDVLSRESVAAIEAAWGPVMQALGYRLVNDPEKLAANSDTWARWEAQVRAVSRYRLEASLDKSGSGYLERAPRS
jgi:Sulfotransferase domain